MHSFPNHGLSEDKINIIGCLMGRSRGTEGDYLDEIFDVCNTL